MSHAQQGEGPAIHTTKDDNKRVWEEATPFRPGSFIFFFSILKLVSFKKLNGAGMRKFPNLSYLHLIFGFIFYSFTFAFLFLLY